MIPWTQAQKKTLNTLQHTATHCNTLQHTATLTQLPGGREGAHDSFDAGAIEEDGDGVSEEGEGSDQCASL